ncbi:genetic competence negative regulator [Halalkalibacter sp. APA_J-10(15)]|uniref:genetic competence negative regulator n=1 Tax=Halalkalibacter sp. APA_J-10(15) TaxID=2933805 RepID=UPI001FF354D6|nr:genetic competence negative regulator [Halalkalibacter sp. APA_J-10(15)]MCK0472152.1 genetic competence negative regulator [Halalkalibacter sp. APA_J-10(15)]
MRLERLTTNKFKAFLSNDDMNERGLTKDDLWQDLPKVHDLFREMMLEADDELGFKIDGPIAVEVYAMPAQGMVIIVSKCEVNEWTNEEFDDGYIEMQVTLDETEDFYYVFDDIESVLLLAERLYNLGIENGTLYTFEGHYYLAFEEFDVDIELEETFVAVLSEYGSPATVSIYRVQEYGKCLMEHNAIKLLYTHFFNH